MANMIANLLTILLFCSTHLALLGRACVDEERRALLELKRGLDDPGGRLSSWAGDHCCSWAGVGCDAQSGRVVSLDLRGMALSGAFSPSMHYVEHLRHLDLSGNDFQFSPIPQLILDSFKNLSYLNLSYAAFTGEVPPKVGNLSALRHLDLSGNLLTADNMAWLQALGRLDALEFLSVAGCGLTRIPAALPADSFRSLSFLDLSTNSFSSKIPGWIFNATNLKHLDISGSSFLGPVPPLVGRMNSLEFFGASSIGDTAPLPREMGLLCNLKTLDLSYTNLSSELTELDEVFSGCVHNSLQHLDMSSSGLTGSLPDWIRSLKKLKSLRLTGNSIHGSIPDWLGRLSSLQKLEIKGNQLNGTITEHLGELSSLEHLDLSGNHLSGVVSESHFSNLTRLRMLDLSSNSLVIHIDSHWIAPFRLELLGLGSCKLGPRFPQWLQNQANLTYLDLSRAGISDIVPHWFWSITSTLNYIDLSNNRISGRLPESLQLGDGDFVQVDLHSNNFYGPIPRIPHNVARLKLSNNSFCGQIPANISGEESILEVLSLSMNNLTGPVPAIVCRLQKLYHVAVSSNHLSGELPDCWSRNSSSRNLQGLDFSDNSFSGEIPGSICSLPSLITLHLSYNGLTGELHSDMKNCTNLVTLDLGFNHLKGELPAWIGESLSNLKILSLKANQLRGAIPGQLARLPYLQILDLSHNNLSGAIPRSFGNFTAMKSVQSSLAPLLTNFISFDDFMRVAMKGGELEYGSVLQLVQAMDLSGNNLSGNIPVELADLAGLQSLNLSSNHLSGEIIDDIGRLRQLVSLDLSRNEFSGEIPTSLAALTYLSYMNLSYNRLSGEIPSGSQIQTLPDPLIYAGNRDLCGFPLPKCGGDHEEPPATMDSYDREHVDEVEWFFVGLAPGFVVGIATVFSVLLFHKRSTDAYFHLVDILYSSFSIVVPSAKR